MTGSDCGRGLTTVMTGSDCGRGLTTVMTGSDCGRGLTGEEGAVVLQASLAPLPVTLAHVAEDEEDDCDDAAH